MMRPEEVLDTVLAGLRDVEAPVGMERRILERLENVAEVRGRAGWRPLWLVGIGRMGLAWGLGCGVVAAAVLIALAIPAGHRPGHDPVRGDDVGAKVAVRGKAAVSAERFEGKRPVLAGMSSVPEQKVRGVAAVAAVQEDKDSVAISEMQAASFPAPPMPLTDEEKLLLRMVHQGDSVELAMLDPKMEALRDAEEKADFQRFFAKAGVKESEGDAVPVTDQAMPPDEKASPVETPAEEPKREQSATVETK